MPDDSLESLVDEFDAERASQRSPGRPGGGADRRRIALAAVGVVALLAAAVLAGRQLIGTRQDPGSRSRQRVAICAETGEVFEHLRIQDGSTHPWKNPRTGRNTLYPAEACYWNADGTAKLEPTYVLLNEYVGKEGPTVCPDCGRTVVGHNPMPPVELMNEALEREREGG